MKQKIKNLIIFLFVSFMFSFLMIFPIIKSYGYTKSFWLDIGAITSFLPFVFYSSIVDVKFVFDRISAQTYHFYAFAFYFVFLILIWEISAIIKKMMLKKHL